MRELNLFIIGLGLGYWIGVASTLLILGLHGVI